MCRGQRVHWSGWPRRSTSSRTMVRRLRVYPANRLVPPTSPSPCCQVVLPQARGPLDSTQTRSTWSARRSGPCCVRGGSDPGVQSCCMPTATFLPALCSSLDTRHRCEPCLATGPTGSSTSRRSSLAPHNRGPGRLPEVLDHVDEFNGDRPFHPACLASASDPARASRTASLRGVANPTTVPGLDPEVSLVDVSPASSVIAPRAGHVNLPQGNYTRISTPRSVGQARGPLSWLGQPAVVIIFLGFSRRGDSVADEHRGA
jgi:hypothetical protein